MKAIDRPVWELELRLAIGESIRTNTHTIHTSAGKYTLQIYTDEEPRNPRENDNFSHMLFSHKRYQLGDPDLWERMGITQDSFSSWNALQDYLLYIIKAVRCFPVRMYSHSGLTISLAIHSYPYNDRWDSAQIGFVFCTKKDISTNWKLKHVTQRYRQIAEELIRSEIKTYDSYLSNDVYGYDLSWEGESIVNIGGYYGTDISNGMIQDLINIIARHTNKVINANKAYLHI